MLPQLTLVAAQRLPGGPDNFKVFPFGEGAGHESIRIRGSSTKACTTRPACGRALSCIIADVGTAKRRQAEGVVARHLGTGDLSLSTVHAADFYVLHM